MKKLVLACLIFAQIFCFGSAAFAADVTKVVLPPPQCVQPELTLAPDSSGLARYAAFPCKPGESYCGGSICCPSGHNAYCSSSNLCYNSVGAAQKACGSSYTICSSPAR